MSKKEDDDKVKMSQCEKKSMVVQGIKDRSGIREVTEKQRCGDVCETREVREGKQGKTRRRVSMRRRGDLGEIQGRSIDPGKIHRSRGFGVRECREGEKSGGTRTARCPKGEGNRGRTVRGFYGCCYTVCVIQFLAAHTLV